MDEQQPIRPQPSGVPPQAGWGTLFKIVGRTWPVAAIWIVGFFIQVEVIKNTGLKDIPWIWRYFEAVLVIESFMLFALFKKLMPRDL